MEKRIKEERKTMVSKGGVPKGRIIPVYLTDEGDVHSTKEIFLGEPSLEGFLHQFRHHLQNKAREPQYKYLLVENDPKADYRIPYKDCVYQMQGEDDARAWARMVIELAS